MEEAGGALLALLVMSARLDAGASNRAIKLGMTRGEFSRKEAQK
jgi:hypothetical protein